MVGSRPPVRTTHLHIIVDADVAPELILQACKAYATRALKGMCEVPNHKYWTRSGDTGDYMQAGFWQAPFTMCWTAKERGWKSTPEMTAHKIPPFHRGLVGAVVEALKCRNSSGWPPGQPVNVLVTSSESWSRTSMLIPSSLSTRTPRAYRVE